jgi:glutamyl-tRNA synthetase
LFNWLFARHHQGKFLIRVEDTDVERSRDEYAVSQLQSLDWCGIQSDEPIVFQSQRMHEYEAVAQGLLSSGTAYRCYCTQEEVRSRGTTQGVQPSGEEYYFYDGTCRTLTREIDKPYVIRMKVPRDRSTIQVHDLLRGTLEFSLNTIDDFVIVRSTGVPMYNFTVVVDDALMGITHIIRGDEHLVNAPRQVLVYEAAGFTAPQFAHVPLILGRDGKKLSKRDAATAVSDYRKQGILPDALCNYLVRLGWSYGDQEIFTVQELISLFSLEQVGVKAAIFDTEKLLWMNSVYIKNKSPQALLEVIEATIPQFRSSLTVWSDTQVYRALELYQQRCQTLVSLVDVIRSLAQNPHIDGNVSPIKDHKITSRLVDMLQEVSSWKAEKLKECLQQYVREHNFSFADVAMPVRYALAGTTQAPAVGDLLELLGPEVSLQRLRNILI